MFAVFWALFDPVLGFPDFLEEKRLKFDFVVHAADIVDICVHVVNLMATVSHSFVMFSILFCDHRKFIRKY